MSPAEREQLEADLFAQNVDAIRAFADRNMGPRLRRVVTLDDVCQEVFARVFASFANDDLGDVPIESFRARLFQHAKWVLASRGRTAHDFRGESAAGDGLGGIADFPEHTDGAVTRADQVRWLHALVEHLDADHGDVVKYRLAGMSYQEIAIRLGVAETTVRKRYSRVLQEFRATYGERPDPAEG